MASSLFVHKSNMLQHRAGRNQMRFFVIVQLGYTTRLAGMFCLLTKVLNSFLTLRTYLICKSPNCQLERCQTMPQRTALQRLRGFLWQENARSACLHVYTIQILHVIFVVQLISPFHTGHFFVVTREVARDQGCTCFHCSLAMVQMLPPASFCAELGNRK